MSLLVASAVGIWKIRPPRWILPSPTPIMCPTPSRIEVASANACCCQSAAPAPGQNGTRRVVSFPKIISARSGDSSPDKMGMATITPDGWTVRYNGASFCNAKLRGRDQRGQLLPRVEHARLYRGLGDADYLGNLLDGFAVIVN